MGFARIQIHHNFLKEFFPEGTEVLSVRPAETGSPDRIFEFLVKHADLPEVDEGHVIPLRNVLTQTRAIVEKRYFV